MICRFRREKDRAERGKERKALNCKQRQKKDLKGERGNTRGFLCIEYPILCKIKPYERQGSEVLYSLSPAIPGIARKHTQWHSWVEAQALMHIHTC